MAWRNLSDTGRSLDLLSRYEGRLDRQYRTALERLHQCQNRAESAVPNPLDAIAKMFEGVEPNKL